jgi:hypothetical protein
MPLALRLDDDSELDDLPMLNPSVPRNSHNGHDRRESKGQAAREKKRAIIYDGEEDAKAIAKALNHHSIDALAVCDILPRLSHDQILDVRKEYKKHVKVSQMREGVVLCMQEMTDVSVLGARQRSQPVETHQDKSHWQLWESSICDRAWQMGERRILGQFLVPIAWKPQGAVDRELDGKI